MKNISLLLALAGAVALAVPRESLAQSADAYSRAYDPSTVETVSGRIISIEHIVHGPRGAYGERLVLNTRQGHLLVHLGPGWFMERQSLKLAPHDEVTITGSRVMLGGKAALIAAWVTKGHETLVLRNAQGLPVWRGSRYR
ncbi:MAG: DNA-binding protein [Steroidobacteraceae bacterium]